MTETNFYKKLNKLRAKIKEKRKQELYEMINDEKNKLEDKIDEKSGVKKEEVRVVEKKQTFHDKFIKQLAGNTPNSGQFDEDI